MVLFWKRCCILAAENQQFSHPASPNFFKRYVLPTWRAPLSSSGMRLGLLLQRCNSDMILRLILVKFDCLVWKNHKNHDFSADKCHDRGRDSFRTQQIFQDDFMLFCNHPLMAEGGSLSRGAKFTLHFDTPSQRIIGISGMAFSRDWWFDSKKNN